MPPLRALLSDFGFRVDPLRLLGLLHEAFTVDPRKPGLIAIGLGAYAVVEVIEGVRAVAAETVGRVLRHDRPSLDLPYEIYDLANKVTVLRVVAFLINLALVLYLVLTKRLFGVRGGKARLRRPGCAVSPSWTPRSPPWKPGNGSPDGTPNRRPPMSQAPPRNRLRPASPSRPLWNRP